MLSFRKITKNFNNPSQEYPIIKITTPKFSNYNYHFKNQQNH